MILVFKMRTGFTAGPNIKWDVLHALRFCTGRYPHRSFELKIRAESAQNCTPDFKRGKARQAAAQLKYAILCTM